MKENFDLIVIGTGPAGEKAAVKAAFFGYKVAIVEKQGLCGGAETLTGTLPSKTLKETALFLSGKQERGLYSLEKGFSKTASVQDFLYRKDVVMKIFAEQIGQNLERHGVSLFRGMGSFVDEHHVQVNGQTLYGQYILIATGSYPYHPNEVAFDGQLIHDSDTILSLTKLPSSLIIYGAGVIGTEYATIFATLGVKVTLINDKQIILPFLDSDIIEELGNCLEEAGITLLKEQTIQQVTRNQDQVSVQLKGGQLLSGDMFLFASGRSGNIADLNLDKIGLAANKRGYLEVSPTYQTKIPHIYAAGDVVGFPSLASTSMEQGRVAVSHMFNIHDLSTLPAAFPYGIYTIPEISYVGKKAEELQGSCLVGKAFYGTMPRGKILGLTQGFLKLIIDKDSLCVLGCHIIGYNAAELIHFGCLLVQDKKTLWDIVGQVFNFPTLHDLYKYAAYDALSQIDQNKKPVQ